MEPEVQDNGISLTPVEAPVDTGVSLSNPVQAPISLPDNVAQIRAVKTQQGIGQHLNKTTEDIKAEIQAGREDSLRQIAASNLNVEKTKAKLQEITRLSTLKGGPLDENEYARVMDPFNPNNQPVNPDSVTETEYAKKYVQSVQEAVDITKSELQNSQNENPEQYAATLDKSSDLTARMEYFRKLRENAEQTVSQQTWPGYLADTAKNMIQPYVEFKMRGNTSDVGYFGGGFLLGTNLQEQADHIFGLPKEEAFAQAKAIGDSLAKDNPQLAVKFYEYLEGLPSTDRVLDNAFTLLTPFDYAAVGKTVGNVAKGIHLENTARKAARQLVSIADKAEADVAAKAEGMGDLSTAATERASNIVLQDMSGKRSPIDQSKEPLLTFLNQDKDKIATAPGNLNGEQVRRIQDAYDASGKSFIQKLTDAVRINRIPMPLAVKNGINILKDTVMDYYPGIRNAILDVSNPLYEPKSNTYWHEVTFGNFDGTLFSNPKTAENFARLHGMDDVQVVEGQGRITNAKVQQLLDQRVQLQKNLNAAEDAIEANRLRMNDNKLPEADRLKAKEQYAGLSDFKKNFQKGIDEVDLRLKSNDTYDRSASLQGKIKQAQAYNKDASKALVKETLSAEDRQILKDSIEANKARIAEHNQELRALKTGKAEVVARGATTVEQHGVGYKIVVRRPLVETDKAVRDLMIRDANGNLIPEAISTNSQKGLGAMFNAALWRMRTSEDTLSLNESIQRKVGTYTQSLFKEWAAQEAAYIRQISSGTIRQDPVTGESIPYWKAKPVSVYNKITGNTHKNYADFIRTLEHARDAKDPITGQPGYFFETPGQLNDHYLKFYGYSPSFAEHQAYFSFVRMVEGDRMLREIAEFRNRARLGVEQFSLSTKDAKGQPVSSGFFDGRKLKKFPGGDDVLMIMGQRQGQEKLINLGGIGLQGQRLEEIRKAVEEGRMSVIELYAPEFKPLREFSDVAGNEHIRYILTDKAQSKPIEFNHVNRRGGGHFEYDYDHFLKQADMYHQYENTAGVKGRYKSVYQGDKTFMPLLNRAMGTDIANKLHTVQDLIKAGKIDEAKDFITRTMPIEPHKLLDMFKPGRDAAGKQTLPALSLEEPFVVVPKGRSVMDIDAQRLTSRYGKAFKDSGNTGSLNKQFSVAYNTERESTGLTHWEDVGSQGNPIYKYAPSGKMVDPITTMNKSLNRIVNSAFMDDYKIYAVEHWLREAEPFLEPVRLKLARSAPNWVFTSSMDKSAFTVGTSPEIVRNLLSNRFKINQFIGVPSSVDTAIHTAKQWLVDTSYNKFGPEANRTLVQKAITIAPNWMLSHLTDPVTFLRSMTFHEKLGLFNPAQLLVQAQTYATILSISPIHGVSGTYAALLHGWSRLNRNPEILSALDNYASKLSVFGQSKWRPGEFKEAMETLERTGFENVAGEYSNLNTALKTDFVGNGFRSLLHAGTFFFTKGEQSTRVGAWYTAFREFREANPTGPLSQANIGKILQRADLLTSNMSRASNSFVNQGVFSLTSQFLTYQLRLAELFLGKRLGDTPFERAMARTRLITFYSLLYGAPSAVGLTGLPMQNSIRSEATQRGYTMGENWLSTAIDQGLPAMAAAFITGKGDWTKGNNYNIGDRLGSPGFTQFTDAMKSDHAWYQLLAGASGTTLLNTLTSTNNFFHAVADVFRPNKEKQFPLKADDFVDIFKEISSVNQAWKLYAAINTGKWLSKNEGYVGDVTKTNAAFMAITGLSPAQQDNEYIKSGIRKSDEEYQKYIMKETIKEMQRYYQDQKDHNYASAKDHFRRADTLMEAGGFPSDRKASVLSMAARGYESMIDSGDYKYATQDVPKSRSDFLGIPMPFSTQSNIPTTRMEQFRTQLQINKNKGQ
jgi:hypothetical protein